MAVLVRFLYAHISANLARRLLTHYRPERLFKVRKVEKTEEEAEMKS